MFLVDMEKNTKKINKQVKKVVSSPEELSVKKSVVKPVKKQTSTTLKKYLVASVIIQILLVGAVGFIGHVLNKQTELVAREVEAQKERWSPKTNA